MASAPPIFTLAFFTIVMFHFRQRYALELGEAVVHDMRSDLFAKLMTMPPSSSTRPVLAALIGG